MKDVRFYFEIPGCFTSTGIGSILCSIICIYFQLQFNIMDGFQWNQIISRFPHIAEGIFDGLDGNTGFQYACKSGHVELVELLIKKSVEFNIDLITKDDSYGNTGFHYACMSGKVKLVELLIKNSVELNLNLNAKNGKGETGYHIACSYDQVKIVGLLIKNSKEFNIVY